MPAPGSEDNLLLAGTKVVPATQFMSGICTDGTFSGIVEYIQTDNTITVSFKIPHDLPSYSTTDNTYPKIVIIMPKAMRKGKSQMNILNLDGSMENWQQGREE